MSGKVKASTATHYDQYRLLLGILVGIAAFVTGTLLLVLASKQGWPESEELRTVFRLFGSFLTVSVLVSFFYKFFVSPMDAAKRKAELRDLLDEKLDSAVNSRYVHGLGAILDGMDYGALFDGLERGDELWWLDTYAPNYKLFGEKLRAAVERGAVIRMLVLKPGTSNARLRAEEIGGEYRTSFEHELKGFREDLRYAMSLRQPETKGSLEVRDYDDLLGAAIYAVRRNGKTVKVVSSFFLGRPTSVGFPHLVWVPAAVNMSDYFFDYVRNKWDRHASHKVDAAAARVVSPASTP